MRVGLTGGVASGKSTVAALLRELGAVVVDADVLAREVVEPGTPGLAAVVAEFGPEVLTADGALDRPALGAIVFADDAARRAALEAISTRGSGPAGRSWRRRRRAAPRRARHPAAGRDRPGRRLRRGARGRRARRGRRWTGWCATGDGREDEPLADRGPGHAGGSGWPSRRTSSTTPGRAKTSVTG